MYLKNNTNLSILIVVIAAILATTGCGPSQEDIDLASKACEDFIQEEFEPYTHVFDTWTKDGKIVVEVGYKEKSWEDKYSVRLCVVDKENGRLSVPSVFNMNEWKK